MIDSHCHLADSAFAPICREVVERARTAGRAARDVHPGRGRRRGVGGGGARRELWPGIRVPSGCTRTTPGRSPAAPDEAASSCDAVEAERAGAIGEIGLDYHYDFSPRDIQQGVFTAQVAVARSWGCRS